MGHLGHIRYPRSIGTHFEQIHIFCDASGSGYGAAAYLKTDLGVHLVYAKGKLVKSISQTIPVLELEHVWLVSKILPKLLKVYQVPPEAVFYWTDSCNAENWIKNPARDLPRPVARRITMLRENSIIQNWRHVPTDLNPADILSRGCKAVNLANNTLWWNGPEFISTGKWPPVMVPPKPHVEIPQESALARLVGIFTLLDEREEETRHTLFQVSNFRRGCRIITGSAYS